VTIPSGGEVAYTLTPSHQGMYPPFPTALSPMKLSAQARREACGNLQPAAHVALPTTWQPVDQKALALTRKRAMPQTRPFSSLTRKTGSQELSEACSRDGVGFRAVERGHRRHSRFPTTAK
jgi:hypothetical protein